MKNYLKEIITELKQEFNLDFRSDAYLPNTFGLTPIMDYEKAKSIINRANEIAKVKGLERNYNLNMEIERLRGENLHFYLKDLAFKLEEHKGWNR
jgi:hypothetical protein